MSYINSALKKVQKEKDGRYAFRGDVVMTRGAQKSPAGKWRVSLFAVGIVVTLVSLSVLVWLSYPVATREANKRSPNITPVTTVASPPAFTVEAFPDKADRLYQEALVAQRGKRWEEAESFYRQVLALDARHLQALNNLGVLYMRKNRSDEAIELFVKAVAAKGDYVDPYYNLACLYSQLGNMEASLHYLQRAVKIDSNIREWAKKDMDFTKMHSLPAFKKITEELIK